ncbi:hypothetical protein [Parabacteroides goldsteinii]|uniref:hypothetical protein n=1 Tax=Parabacteroides goldsteinii TaxID=328812 RepID=UPI001CC99D15|nr:hypothetical protein [Parabacteroides goldsteinii]
MVYLQFFQPVELGGKIPVRVVPQVTLQALQPPDRVVEQEHSLVRADGGEGALGQGILPFFVVGMVRFQYFSVIRAVQQLFRLFQYGPHPFRQAASCSLMDEREAAQANRGQVADVAFSDIVVQQFRKAVVRPFRPCKAVYGLIGDIRPAQGQLRLPEQIIAAFIVTVAHGIVRQPAFSVHIEKDERSALFQIGFFFHIVIF